MADPKPNQKGPPIVENQLTGTLGGDILGTGGFGLGSGGADDRYTKQLKNVQQTAAFGTYLPNIMKWKTGVDYTKEIQFSIRREFFTLTQVTYIIYWSLTIGAVIGAAIIAAWTPGGFVDVLGDNAVMIWGVFLLSFGLAAAFSEHKAKSSYKKCTKDKYKKSDTSKGIVAGVTPKVEPAFQGKDCFNEWDCTRKNTIVKGSCHAPKPKFHFIRTTFIPLVVVIGAIMTGVSFSSTDFRLAKKDLAQAIIYGIGCGNFFILFFS